MKRAAPGPRARMGPVSGLALAAYSGAALAPLIAILALAPAGAAGATGGVAGALSALTEPRSLRALGFTIAQAAASSLAALAIGLPGAALVATYAFPGRRTLKALSVLPFGMPSVLMVLAMVLFYGRSGYLNRFLMWAFGLGEPPLGFLYGFWGIVVAHGLYEFPIVLQTVGEVWERLPRDREEAARLLGAGRLRAFATGTLPSLVPAIAQATALSFLLCFFSFAVVMVFGGLAGSTLEVEVYRRARLEADAPGAAAIALAETAMALGIVALVSVLERKVGYGSAAVGAAGAKAAGSPRLLIRPRGRGLAALVAYSLVLALGFGGPMLSILLEAFSVRSGPLGPASPGLGNFAKLLAPESPFLAALGATLATALPAALVATVLGAAGAFALRRAGPVAKAAAALPLAVSGIVASLGWSLIFPRGGVALIPLALALGAMPYALRSIAAALATLDHGPVEAARTLGAGRLRAALGVELGAVLPTVLAALAFAFAASAGEVGVPLALGQGGFEPLPVYLYRLTSSYRFPEACAAGVVLAALGAAAFALKEGRKGA
jgi:thiamine transport system permease protein